ncbi:MAG TPA: PEP-CTERM sorting domain-containing protein [Casimicrobiaceae bacterium]|jgi:hypothetical protein|nr:PEP-CTERM sorting domain-containing protein [Casimicrobiaceae bacterium]
MSNFLTVRTASRRAAAVMVGLGLACIGAGAQATLFTGSVYYTHFAGGNNVLRTSFSYDDVSGVVSYGAQTPITNVNGADGIIFAPNGNLIVTSNTTSNVYRINASTGALLQTLATGTPGFPDFHMALDPNNSQFYSSNRYNRTFGPLDTFTINGDGSFNDATTTPILDSATGGLSNVTQIAFAPNGRVMYTDGVPNSNGSIGLFNFGVANDTTTELIPANQVPAAHGMIYDPFTGLMTMFGGGQVATIDPTQATNALIAGSLLQFDVPNIGDFDQGAVDGHGHAFIAGSGAITFIDYSISHDITKPDRVVITGGFGDIDDIAPLVGPGSNPNPTPEPGTLLLILLAMSGVAAARRIAR